MSSALERHQNLKRDAERLRRDHDREEGALRQHLQRLKDEFGFQDEEEAGKWIMEMEINFTELEKKYAKEEKAFRDKWEDKLG